MGGWRCERALRSGEVWVGGGASAGRNTMGALGGGSVSAVRVHEERRAKFSIWKVQVPIWKVLVPRFGRSRPSLRLTRVRESEGVRRHVLHAGAAVRVKDVVAHVTHVAAWVD